MAEKAKELLSVQGNGQPRSGMDERIKRTGAGLSGGSGSRDFI